MPDSDVPQVEPLTPTLTIEEAMRTIHWGRLGERRRAVSSLVVRITSDGENVTRIEFRRGLRWLPLTPDNAMFADAELFDAAQRYVFRLINEDLRRQAEGEA